jgi:carbamoyltransferase
MNVLGVYGAFGWNPRNEDHIKDDIGQHLLEWVHDAGASLFVDGEHVCSIQEERLSRVKFDGNEPRLSIEYCLDAGDLQYTDIDKVCVATPGSPCFKTSRFDNNLQAHLEKIFPKATIAFYPHHSCHASVAIYTSTQTKGAFITNDGSGEAIAHDSLHDGNETQFATSIVERGSLGYFNKDEGMLRIFHDIPYTNCLGSHWASGSEKIFCGILGKKHNNGEYYRADMDSMHGKIMGLCAYGSDMGNDPDFEKKYIYVQTNKDFGYNGRPYVGELYPHWSEDVEGNELTFAERSYVLQRNHEEALQQIVDGYYKQGYLEDNMCFSGGVFLNVKANTWLKQSPYMNDVHIPPYTTDVGLHLGAAFLGLVDEGVKYPKMPENIALLGKQYDSHEIETAIKEAGLYYEHRPFDIFNIAAEYINDNKIVAWFQGRSEFGPRALGSRSILMSPKVAENKDVLNERVKHREDWRPFAGIILDEYLTEYFEEDFESPYMLYALTVKEDKVSEIPAITHLDRSCRVQTVNNVLNSDMTQLLNAVKMKTGTPIVLNTSFNDNGEPIVESPTDAMKAFLKMDIDVMIIGNYMVCKS